jgi:SAM-dependent methyltransferase
MTKWLLVIEELSEIMNNFYKQKSCLACDSERLDTILDLGVQPLANSYKNTREEKENCYPLSVNLCQNCFHLQLTDIVDPEIIYKNYLYTSGTSKTLKDYSNWFAGYVNEIIEKKTNNILDIGCNDGTQLDSFKELNFQTFGIDPAENIYQISSKNHSVMCDFFGPSILSGISEKFDAIIAQNVFAHNPNPLQFLECCKKLMSSHTLLVIQTSQANMILNNEFDTIYHEHINFFNANSIKKIADRAGLFLLDIIKTPIHGNSYVFILGIHNRRPKNIENVIMIEENYGLLDHNTYTRWHNNVQKNVKDLVRTIDDFLHQGFVLVGYGAAAKGNTLLNFANITLDFIIDDNALKQEKFSPGSGCPIVPINKLDEYTNQDRILFVPLAWNFFEEIKHKIKSKRNNPNDKFLKYFPTVEIISNSTSTIN